MGRQQVRQLALCTLVPVVLRGASALAAVGIVYFLSSRLNGEQAGLFLWCMALVGILGTVVRVGLDNVLVREAALLGRPEALPSLADLLAGALAVILPPLALAVLVLAAFPETVAVLQGNPALAGLLPGFALVLACSVLALVVSRLLIGLQRPVAGLALEGVLLPLLFIAMVWPLAQADLDEAVQLYALAAVLVLGVALLLLARLRPGRPLADPRATARDLLARGVPLWIVMVMADVTVWGGMLIVGIMSPARDVALLAVAQRLASVVSLILQAVRAVVAPRFAALNAAGDRAGLRRLVRASALVNLAWAAPLMVLLLLLPTEILALFGEAYTGGRNVLLILATGQLVNAGVGNWGALLSMTGHEAMLRNISVGTGVLTLVALPPALLAAGLEGAAAVMAGSVVLQNLLTMRYGRRLVLASPAQQA